jgi:hypothetical protein
MRDFVSQLAAAKRASQKALGCDPASAQWAVIVPAANYDALMAALKRRRDKRNARRRELYRLRKAGK